MEECGNLRPLLNDSLKQATSKTYSINIPLLHISYTKEETVIRWENMIWCVRCMILRTLTYTLRCDQMDKAGWEQYQTDRQWDPCDVLNKRLWRQIAIQPNSRWGEIEIYGEKEQYILKASCKIDYRIAVLTVCTYGYALVHDEREQGHNDAQ